MGRAASTWISRRRLISGAAAFCAAARCSTPAVAQQVGSIDQPAAKSRNSEFDFSDLLNRAEELSNRPFAPAHAAPKAIPDLSYDAYREIQFRREKAFPGEAGEFRLHLFHLGYLFRSPVTVNIERGGVFAPIPYARNLFEFGKSKLSGKPDMNMGFAGFKLTYPLNEPDKADEFASFLGASYFRVLAHGQRYGLSARALAIRLRSRWSHRSVRPQLFRPARVDRRHPELTTAIMPTTTRYPLAGAFLPRASPAT